MAYNAAIRRIDEYEDIFCSLDFSAHFSISTPSGIAVFGEQSMFLYNFISKAKSSLFFEDEVRCAYFAEFFIERNVFVILFATGVRILRCDDLGVVFDAYYQDYLQDLLKDTGEDAQSIGIVCNHGDYHSKERLISVVLDKYILILKLQKTSLIRLFFGKLNLNSTLLRCRFISKEVVIVSCLDNEILFFNFGCNILNPICTSTHPHLLEICNNFNRILVVNQNTISVLKEDGSEHMVIKLPYSINSIIEHAHGLWIIICPTALVVIDSEMGTTQPPIILATSQYGTVQKTPLTSFGCHGSHAIFLKNGILIRYATSLLLTSEEKRKSNMMSGVGHQQEFVYDSLDILNDTERLFDTINKKPSTTFRQQRRRNSLVDASMLSEPLLQKIKKGILNKEVIRFALVNLKEDINQIDENGEGLAFYTLRYLRNDAYNQFQLLHRFNIDWDITNKDGFTALMVACTQPTAEMRRIVQFLLHVGVDLTKRDYLGQSLFHKICHYYTKDAAKVLFSTMKHVEDFSAILSPDIDGWTPLHYACRYVEDHLSKIIAMLIKKGCDPFAKNNLGQSPLDFLVDGYASDKANCITIIYDLTGRLDELPVEYREILQEESKMEEDELSNYGFKLSVSTKKIKESKKIRRKKKNRKHRPNSASNRAISQLRNMARSIPTREQLLSFLLSSPNLCITNQRGQSVFMIFFRKATSDDIMHVFDNIVEAMQGIEDFDSNAVDEQGRSILTHLCANKQSVAPIVRRLLLETKCRPSLFDLHQVAHRQGERVELFKLFLPFIDENTKSMINFRKPYFEPGMFLHQLLLSPAADIVHCLEVLSGINIDLDAVDPHTGSTCLHIFFDRFIDSSDGVMEYQHIGKPIMFLSKSQIAACRYILLEVPKIWHTKNSYGFSLNELFEKYLPHGIHSNFSQFVSAIHENKLDRLDAMMMEINGGEATSDRFLSMMTSFESFTEEIMSSEIDTCSECSDLFSVASFNMIHTDYSDSDNDGSVCSDLLSDQVDEYSIFNDDVDDEEDVDFSSLHLEKVSDKVYRPDILNVSTSTTDIPRMHVDLLTFSPKHFVRFFPSYYQSLSGVAEVTWIFKELLTIGKLGVDRARNLDFFSAQTGLYFKTVVNIGISVMKMITLPELDEETMDRARLDELEQRKRVVELFKSVEISESFIQLLKSVQEYCKYVDLNKNGDLSNDRVLEIVSGDDIRFFIPFVRDFNYTLMKLIADVQNVVPGAFLSIVPIDETLAWNALIADRFDAIKNPEIHCLLLNRCLETYDVTESITEMEAMAFSETKTAKCFYGKFAIIHNELDTLTGFSSDINSDAQSAQAVSENSLFSQAIETNLEEEAAQGISRSFAIAQEFRINGSIIFENGGTEEDITEMDMCTLNEEDVVIKVFRDPSFVDVAYFLLKESGVNMDGLAVCYGLIKMPYGSIGLVMKRYTCSLETMCLSSQSKYVFFTSVADTLNNLHSNGFLHGNLKPSNILFDDDKCVYLADLRCHDLKNEFIHERDISMALSEEERKHSSIFVLKHLAKNFFQKLDVLNNDLTTFFTFKQVLKLTQDQESCVDYIHEVFFRADKLSVYGSPETILFDSYSGFSDVYSFCVIICKVLKPMMSALQLSTLEIIPELLTSNSMQLDRSLPRWILAILKLMNEYDPNLRIGSKRVLDELNVEVRYLGSSSTLGSRVSLSGSLTPSADLKDIFKRDSGVVSIDVSPNMGSKEFFETNSDFDDEFLLEEDVDAASLKSRQEEETLIAEDNHTNSSCSCQLL
ncbi:hypothetical protein PCE1_000738 [Barthelona sp. PCE]